MLTHITTTHSHSLNHPMNNKRVAEGFQKSTTITNNCFEVLANLNGPPDCNPLEMERKFQPGSRKIL
jgi:hypothetical protein